MTARHNIWLMRDESAQQSHGAVRSDTITEITPYMITQDSKELRLLQVGTGAGTRATLGACLPEYRDHMVHGLLSVLRQAEEFAADFVVVEAVPLGPDAPHPVPGHARAPDGNARPGAATGPRKRDGAGDCRTWMRG
ncbi:hypothetical protein [Actinoplanes siamensis]|uniref:Uncharacterized protein n=1 Tax=Actinoplanes siamensis TaxID=1223317 RepID=A0A919NFL0_9ACTN|nr:hypothetical protein [Actinoplanes siamensis]GIF09917.1 hypothetical protein Asi03nite_74550 [Actinoplanes siamensis]